MLKNSPRRPRATAKPPPARKSATHVTGPRRRARQLKAAFDAVHTRGMRALDHHDHKALTTAIAEEKAIIAEQVTLIRKHLAASRLRVAEATAGLRDGLARAAGAGTRRLPRKR